MMAGLILSSALALLMGMAIVTLLWPRRRLRAGLLMKASLATGLGLGATSCLWFLGLVAAPGHLDNLPVAEIVVLAVLVTCAVLRHRPRKISARRFEGDGPVDARRAGGGPRGLPDGRGVFALDSAREPHGGWDAWSMQNLHARFLYRGGEQWTDLFSKPLTWSSLDYPLLLPALRHAQLGLRRRRNRRGAHPGRLRFHGGRLPAALLRPCASARKAAASLAVIVLAGTPFFIGHAAAQYADVPLAFFYLATLVLLCLAERESAGGRGLLALAGLACGMAAWTKNEGLLFMICVLLREDLDFGQAVRPQNLLETDVAVPRRIGAGAADRAVLQGPIRSAQ